MRPVSGATSPLLQLFNTGLCHVPVAPPGGSVYRTAPSRSGERTQVGSQGLVCGWLSMRPPFCDGSNPVQRPACIRLCHSHTLAVPRPQEAAQ